MESPAIDLEGNLAILLFPKRNLLNRTSSSNFESLGQSLETKQNTKGKNAKEEENYIRLIKIEIS